MGPESLKWAGDRYKVGVDRIQKSLGQNKGMDNPCPVQEMDKNHASQTFSFTSPPPHASTEEVQPRPGTGGPG